MPEPASIRTRGLRIASPVSPRGGHDLGVGAGLPTPATPLIGREDVRNTARTLLRYPDVRLVTFTGPPGIGKTHLALQIAADLSDAFAGAVVYVSLASIRDHALVLPTIARAVGVVQRDEQPLTAGISAALRFVPVLLVLDNFEQVLPAAVQIAELLTLCPLLSVLVTSRAVLHVRGEHELAIPPLALPDLAALPDHDTLERCESVALFLARAQAVIPGFTLTVANAAAVAGICVQIDGLPLAIELAVARLKLFPPNALLQRLDHRLRWLTEGARDLPPRQRTLRNAIAWSDDLLSATERRLFYMLSVFAGGWTLAALETLTTDDMTSVADVLASLLDKSLIHRAAHLEDEPRFGMFETIREYAHVRLVECGEYAASADRHAAWVLAFAADAGAHLYRAEQAMWLDRCDRDLNNIRAALTWMLAHDEIAQALQCCIALRNFWLVRDHLTEGTEWLESILSRTTATVSASARADGLLAAAALALRRGDYPRGQALYAQGLAIGQELHDVAIIAPTMLNLGSVAVIRGDLDGGQALFEQSLTLAQEAKQWRTVARGLNQLGELARLRGNDEHAARYYEESLAHWRELGERERIAMALHNLGFVRFRLHDGARAVHVLCESLAISTELHNVHGGAICLTAIAPILSTYRHADRAAQLLGAADALRSAIDVRWEPVDQAEYDRGVVSVRDALGAAAFHMHTNRGRGLTFAEAMAYAHESLSLVTTQANTLTRAPRRAANSLTARERTVVIEIARGKSNREIADILYIAEKTVEMHISNSLGKLNFRSRSQLATWAVTHLPAAFDGLAP